MGEQDGGNLGERVVKVEAQDEGHPGERVVKVVMEAVSLLLEMGAIVGKVPLVSWEAAKKNCWAAIRNLAMGFGEVVVVEVVEAEAVAVEGRVVGYQPWVGEQRQDNI